MRAPGMTFWRMPLLVWANFATSTLVVLATPFIAGSQFFVMFDRVMHTNFFETAEGGYVLGYQHIFWFYSHPAVYIMMLPGFGIISEVVSVMARKPIFGYRLMALSLLAILVLGFSVWAHHMYVAGMASWLRVPMMVTTLLIAVPTGIKIFSWVATIWGGKIHFTTPMLWAIGFIAVFTIGGLSGIYLGSVPIDIQASDTYFIVAHIHYVLFGGSMFTVFAGIYYWFPKMTGRMYNEKLGKLHFWLTFIAFNLTFFPMHYIGLQGMPRRVADYAGRFADFNLFISIASFGLGASTVIFLYNMIHSWKYGEKAEANPWHAMTLEWQVSSPPPIFNFDEIPQVVGGPVRVRRPGCPPRDPAAVPPLPSPSPRAATDGLTHVLVIANETVASSALLGALREEAAGDSALHVTVIAPVSEPRHGYVVFEDTRRASAGPPPREDARHPARLGHPRAGLRGRHEPRAGGEGRDGPARAPAGRDRRLDAPRSPLRLASPRRHRRHHEGRRGRPGEARRRRRRRPRRARAERARGRERDGDLEGASRHDPRARREGPGELPHRLAAGERRPAPRGRPACCGGALSGSGSDGIDAHGQVVHPDPFTAAMEAHERRARRRDHRLDLPLCPLRLASP